MAAKESCRLVDGIWATHAASGDFASEIVVDKRRIKIRGRHIRWNEG
jgi:hypothetical protein